MSLGLVIALFLIFMVLLSTSSWSQWRLSRDAPLDIDKLLPLPWAGYGSSVVSLSALFGAYSATLLILGPVCFVGVVTGVLSGIFVVSRRIVDLGKSATGFQELLFSLAIFVNPISDRIYWLCLAGAQLGLAMCELVLLQQVFRQGVGLTGSSALVATLSIGLVCYFYCLLAGYQAVFRTDVLQYLVLLIMGSFMLFLPVVDNGTAGSILEGSGTARDSIRAVPFGSEYLETPSPLRWVLEFLVGFSLGIMPVLGAPDTWKRLLILQGRTHAGRAPIALLVAAAAPVALILPLFFRLADRTSAEMFPLQFIFTVSSPLASGLLLLGMISAFMSTFDSAIVSGTHLLLKTPPLFDSRIADERQRYHVLLGSVFLSLALLLTAVSEKLPHPYAVGIFLLGPVGIVVGLLAGSSMGRRQIDAQWVMSACAVAFVSWIIVFRYYLNLPYISKNPAAALVPVGLGSFMFFAFALIGRMSSKQSDVRQ